MGLAVRLALSIAAWACLVWAAWVVEQFYVHGVRPSDNTAVLAIAVAFVCGAYMFLNLRSRARSKEHA